MQPSSNLHQNSDSITSPVLSGSPTGCTVHNSEKLDGFDMGGYFEKPHRMEPKKQIENGAIKQQLIRNYESTQLN